ncbi:MAG: type B 50S ribosomal protein L31 [Okeania sp. SIO1H5]|uniref:type B 50S ribosomal protein L31 n=1 Tax=Okeania sp. SIO1H5 TaxID=2607777 RepID=UPI0013B74AF7|nr:type B 50S ribosomal protein L31 [Okeania sp. SIO1H5]NET23784.1 type B 50S ribosomal protein L31 [Okeania sp. SIO1H5]
MKDGIHPEYKQVVFKDMSNDNMFLIGSTLSSNETIEWEDGNKYPLVKLEISSTSHPFYTGQQRFVDSQGRVEKFKQKFGEKVVGKTQRKSRKQVKLKPKGQR